MADKTIGKIALQGNSKLIFSVSEWRGKPFASVRKFVATQKYEGPTKAGLALSQMLLRQLTAALASLEKTIPAREEHEFKRIPKSNTEYIKIAILPSEEEEGLPAIDIREFVDSPAYVGPTKRGVRFRWNLLPDVIACLCEQAKVIGEDKKNEPSLFGTGFFAQPEEPSDEQEQQLPGNGLVDMLGEALKQFPYDFVDDAADKCTQLSLPDTPLRLEQDNTGAYVLKTEETVFVPVRNPAEANFIIYAQMRGHREVTPPKEMINIFKTVKAYENYVRSLRARLFASLLKKARQESVANYETNKLLSSLGLPKLEQ